MNSNIINNLVYNELEYFTYLNHWLLFLFFFIILFYINIKISTIYFNKVYYNDTIIEFLVILFSLCFLLFLISPALIILLDIDTIRIPSFIIYSLGYQWAWTHSIYYLHSNIGYISFHDHYTISSYFYINKHNNNNILINTINKDNNNIILVVNIKNIINNIIYNGWIIKQITILYTNYIILPLLNNIILIYKYLNIKLLTINYYLNNLLSFYTVDTQLLTVNNIVNNIIHSNLSNYNINLTNYLIEINNQLIIPLYSSIKLYCFSLDVIHSLSFYSFGFKLDSIPGRINLITFKSFIKGINRAYCYELCGEQHNTMLNIWIITTIYTKNIINTSIFE